MRTPAKRPVVSVVTGEGFSSSSTGMGGPLSCAPLSASSHTQPRIEPSSSSQKD
jgi:hypothetical protein